jgi:hypothetical protein
MALSVKRPLKYEGRAGLTITRMGLQRKTVHAMTKCNPTQIDETEHGLRDSGFFREYPVREG